MTDPRNKPLKLAVVGHTNVGKTSLLRTLTRDVGFGEVSHRPSTTRHVEGARLSVDGEALLELYDTPGLEDAIALLDYLEHLERPGERLDGPARLARHGIDRVITGSSTLVPGGGRINLTLRRAH